jgi:hypothetical protein
MQECRKPLLEICSRLAKTPPVLLLIALLLWTVAGAAQQPQTPPEPKQPPAAAPPSQPAQPAAPAQPPQAPQPNGATPTEVPGVGVEVEEQQSPAPAQQQPQQPTGPITKEQAKELFRSVDQILQFVSSDTGLPINHSVKRKLIKRQEVENYVEKRIKEDKDTQKLERSQAILKKFGLLPPDYDLHTEFLRLLAEQVAAYYDAKTKTVNLLDWVPPDQQKPVLAHELTHALQDQKIGLEKWELAGAKDDQPLPDNQEEVVEEAQAARQAVTEGQAMVVFLDYSLAPLGKDVLSAPELVDAMRAGMGDSADSPVFSRAPMFLKESLLMPYTFGTDFVRYVLVHQGKPAAYGGVLERPPADTRQIMEPERYLANDTVEPLKVPELDKLIGSDYERYDFGGMGEFDVYLLAKQYAPTEDAKKYYMHWRRGYYLAVHRKGTSKEQVGLIYVSRWDSPDAAAAFAKMYEAYVPKRYTQWFTGGQKPEPVTSGEPGQSEWQQGPAGDRVTVSQRGSDLLILESLDKATAERVEQALLGSAAPASGSQR